MMKQLDIQEIATAAASPQAAIDAVFMPAACAQARPLSQAQLRLSPAQAVNSLDLLLISP